MSCLFCNQNEPNYKPDPGTEFICSRCTGLLSTADQKDLQKAYLKAVTKIEYWTEITKESPTAIDILESFKRKLKALKGFVKDIPEPKNQGGKKHHGKTQNTKRDLGRIGHVRTSKFTLNR